MFSVVIVFEEVKTITQHICVGSHFSRSLLSVMPFLQFFSLELKKSFGKEAKHLQEPVQVQLLAEIKLWTITQHF